MGDKTSPTRPKRQPKASTDDGFGHWDCSVCTFRNSAEAFKCLMCDVRKGTSTRKPRPQVNQHFAPPTHHRKDKKGRFDKDRSEKEPSLKRKHFRKTRPRLKNIDRSSAQHLEVTVGKLTVIITDFKEKVRPSATSVDQPNSSSSSSDHTEAAASQYSSPHRDSSSGNKDTH
ncbi:YY1-associated factor 2-like [Boleophthalmus pectinirostris]|uniref:YY1-associated factor 2-like n=1 Tax=Boleophthalmus pectinirostris TaxID=150288 RepID=UPI00242DA803|nr:YY1-associated factor 2-like [Boleophthalmus pectinirostris]